MQQIILPANFQGLKNLQGFKVIQQGNKIRLLIILFNLNFKISSARIVPSYTTSLNTSNIITNTSEGQQSTSIPKDASKE